MITKQTTQAQRTHQRQSHDILSSALYPLTDYFWRPTMLRTIAILAALLGLCAAGGATWSALQPPLESLIVPGASNVQVIATGWGAWQIAYRAPGRPYTWYYATAHRLEAQGWTALDPWRPDAAGTGSVYTPIVPLRFQQLYVLIQDQVVLLPDERSPNIAHIQMRRSIMLRWRLDP